MPACEIVAVGTVMSNGSGAGGDPAIFFWSGGLASAGSIPGHSAVDPQPYPAHAGEVSVVASASIHPADLFGVTVARERYCFQYSFP